MLLQPGWWLGQGNSTTTVQLHSATVRLHFSDRNRWRSAGVVAAAIP